MAYESLGHIKEGYERLQARVRNIKKEAERAFDRGFAVVEVCGTAAAAGYANERWGDADPNGQLKELKLFGIPADLTASIGLIGISFFGGLGEYEKHGFNVGNGLGAAFGYRFGAELGIKAGAAHPAATKTSGSAPEIAGSRGGGAGRRYHVNYAHAGV